MLTFNFQWLDRQNEWAGEASRLQSPKSFSPMSQFNFKEVGSVDQIAGVGSYNVGIC